jgi:hypothetical protein
VCDGVSLKAAVGNVLAVDAQPTTESISNDHPDLLHSVPSSRTLILGMVNQVWGRRPQASRDEGQ